MSPLPRSVAPALAAAGALLLGAVGAPAAGAATADANLTGGTLSFINGTPADVTFPAVGLDGTNKTTAKTQAFDVSDARGSGVGWNITATSTLFTSGANTLPAGATKFVTTPTPTCDPTVVCTLATNSITGTYNLPAGVTAPTATRMFNAATNTGLGAQTITPNWELDIPGNARAGTYTSTWTFSLVSGP